MPSRTIIVGGVAGGASCAARLRRLDERYAEKDQTGFIAFVREDGNLLDAGTDPVKALLH
jgi:hypothetical protein